MRASFFGASFSSTSAHRPPTAPSVRALLEALPLLGLAVEIRGVPVRRTALFAYRVGDAVHDLDQAEHVLEGRLPLRGPVESFGRISETWIIGAGSEAERRVRCLRSTLGSHNVRQDTVHPVGFTAGDPDKLAIRYLVLRGRRAPAIELPASVGGHIHSKSVHFSGLATNPHVEE